MTDRYYVEPPVNLAPGPGTAAWVLRLITERPELHDQRYWDGYARGSTKCGTTHCVGGWALYAQGQITPSLLAVADMGPQTTMCDITAPLLGVSPKDAFTLFYSTTNDGAVTALEFLAAGQPIDWQAVFGNGWDAMLPEDGKE